MPYVFAGFDEPNYTQIPDVFFDEVMCELTEAELRVALYIMRRTFGFKKRADTISLSQFLTGIRTRAGEQLDRGCGLRSPTHLSRALQGLEEKGIIRRIQQFDERGGNKPTLYTLRFRHDPLPEGYTPSTAAVDPPPTPTVEAPLPFRQTQETVEQETEVHVTDQQETERISKTSKETSDLEKSITEVSRTLDDLKHVRSNRTRATNLAEQYSLDEYTMVKLCHGVLETVKPKAKSLERPMAYFFEALEDRCKSAPGGRRSLAGKYWRMVQR